MKKPATTWPTAVPTSLRRPTASSPRFPICSCALSSASLIWESVTLSGPVRSQSRIWSMPSVTCFDRSPIPDVTWLPTNVIPRAISATPNTTISSAPSFVGIPNRCSQPRSGLVSAAISRAMTSGSTTTRKRLSSHRMMAVAAQMAANLHAQAAARSTP